MKNLNGVAFEFGPVQDMEETDISAMVKEQEGEVVIEDENTFLRKKILEVTTRCKKAMKAYKQLKAVHSECEGDSQDLEQALEDNAKITSQLEISKADYERLVKDYEELESSSNLQVSALTEKLEAMEEEILQLGQNDVGKELEEMKILNEEFQKQEQVYRKRISDQENELSELRALNAKLLQENSETSTSPAAEHSHSFEIWNRLKTVLEEQEKLKHDFEVELAAKTSSLQVAQSQLLELYSSNDELLMNIERLNEGYGDDDAIRELKQELKEAERQKGMFEVVINTLSDQKSALESELEDALRKLESIGDKQEVDSVDVEKFERENIELQAKYDSLTQRYESILKAHAETLAKEEKRFDGEESSSDDEFEESEKSQDSDVEDSFENVRNDEMSQKDEKTEDQTETSSGILGGIKSFFSPKPIKQADLSQDTSFKYDPVTKKWVDSSSTETVSPTKKKLPPKRKPVSSTTSSAAAAKIPINASSKQNPLQTSLTKSRYANNFASLGFGKKEEINSHPTTTVPPKPSDALKEKSKKKSQRKRKSQNVNQNIESSLKTLDEISEFVDTLNVPFDEKSSELSLQMSFSWNSILLFTLVFVLFGVFAIPKGLSSLSHNIE